MELLFERFLSEERGEWPDIDLDLPSGDQREKVIQYVYQRYGPHGAAMTANVITYRDRSAAREVAKALGYSPAAGEQAGQTARYLAVRHQPWRSQVVVCGALGGRLRPRRLLASSSSPRCGIGSTTCPGTWDNTQVAW